MLEFFRRVCKTARSNYYLRHVCLSVRPSALMEQLSSHCTDFHQIRYLSIFRKSAEKIEVTLKSDKDNVRVLDMRTYVSLR
jgi:hypothetical protein